MSDDRETLIGFAPMANLVSSNRNPSMRQDRLSQDARDLLAWAFREGFFANDFLPIPMNAAEVRIGGDECRRIALGDGGGFIKHGGSDSLRYMKHSDDDDWALVFSHDCDGCPERGATVAARFAG